MGITLSNLAKDMDLFKKLLKETHPTGSHLKQLADVIVRIDTPLRFHRYPPPHTPAFQALLGQLLGRYSDQPTEGPVLVHPDGPLVDLVTGGLILRFKDLDPLTAECFILYNSPSA